VSDAQSALEPKEELLVRERRQTEEPQYYEEQEGCV